MENKAEHIKQKLIGLADGKMGDSYIEKKTINEGFKLAVKNGDGETVKQALECRLISNVHLYLVRQGADINISFNSIVCKSLMDYFIKKKDGEMIKYLIERGFQFNGASRRYRIAVELVNSENMDYLEYLLEKVEPDNRGFKKDVLEYALCQEKAEVIQYIVKNMSSKEQRYCDHIIRNSIKNSINLGSYIDFLKGCGIDVSRIMSR